MSIFNVFAARIARGAGHPLIFIGACLFLIAWVALGPTLDYSNDWQLVMTTVTSIIPFLMVFIIQNTQNRDSQAMHIKLDELLRAIEEANTDFCDLEERGDAELKRLHAKYIKMASEAKDSIMARKKRIETKEKFDETKKKKADK